MAASPHPETTWSAVQGLPQTSTTSVTCWLQFSSKACVSSPEHLGSLQARRYDINGKNKRKSVILKLTLINHLGVLLTLPKWALRQATQTADILHWPFQSNWEPNDFVFRFWNWTLQGLVPILGGAEKTQGSTRIWQRPPDAFHVRAFSHNLTRMVYECSGEQKAGPKGRERAVPCSQIGDHTAVLSPLWVFIVRKPHHPSRSEAKGESGKSQQAQIASYSWESLSLGKARK